MAIFRRGDMWEVYDEVDLFLVTTNSKVKTDGRLVMGKGIAKQTVSRFKGLDCVFGQLVKESCGDLGTYGLLIPTNSKIGAFQVKWDWREPASPMLIKQSVYQLLLWGRDNPGKTVALNYPGIGSGRLHPAMVKQWVEILPDSVLIFRY